MKTKYVNKVQKDYRNKRLYKVIEKIHIFRQVIVDLIFNVIFRKF